MVEVAYTVGRSLVSHIGKGKALLGMLVSGVASGETITTPFKRCVPVVCAAVGAAATDDTNVTESGGQVTITSATTCPTSFQVLILGEMY